MLIDISGSILFNFFLVIFWSYENIAQIISCFWHKIFSFFLNITIRITTNYHMFLYFS